MAYEYFLPKLKSFIDWPFLSKHSMDFNTSSSAGMLCYVTALATAQVYISSSSYKSKIRLIRSKIAVLVNRTKKELCQKTTKQLE
jgi:hypothetical protein